MSTTAPPSPIGPNIRIAREAKQLTQLALAHAMGWTGKNAGAQISRFESGQKEPRLSTIQRIADALGMGLSEILQPPEAKLHDGYITPYARQLIKKHSQKECQP